VLQGIHTKNIEGEAHFNDTHNYERNPLVALQGGGGGILDFTPQAGWTQENNEKN